MSAKIGTCEEHHGAVRRPLVTDFDWTEIIDEFASLSKQFITHKYKSQGASPTDDSKSDC